MSASRYWTPQIRKVWTEYPDPESPWSGWVDETYYQWNPGSGYASPAAYLAATRDYPEWVAKYVDNYVAQGNAPDTVDYNRARGGFPYDEAGFFIPRADGSGKLAFGESDEFGNWPARDAYYAEAAQQLRAPVAVPYDTVYQDYTRSEIPQAGYSFDAYIQKQYQNPRWANVPGVGKFLLADERLSFDWGLGDRSSFFETVFKEMLPAAVKMYGIATGITTVWNAAPSLIESASSIAADAGAQVVPEVAADAALDTVADVASDAFIDTVADIAPDAFIDTVADIAPDAFIDTVADVIPDALVDTVAETVYTSGESVLTEGAGVDDWFGDWNEGYTYDEWADYSAYDPSTAYGADAWDAVIPDVTAPPVPVDTMPYPGAPVDVYTPPTIPTAPPVMPSGASTPLPWERILTTGAEVIRSIMQPTAGQRIDPRTGRAIPPGVQLDPRTGLPMLDARGQYIPMTRAAGVSPLMIAAGAGLLFLALKGKRS